MNHKQLPIERLVKLEKYLNQETTIDNLTIEDIEYLQQAKKIPLEEFLKDREYYLKNFLLLNEVGYNLMLMRKYSYIKDELYDRYVTANIIREYYNKKVNETYKIHKKMVRKLTQANHKYSAIHCS